MQVVNLSLKSPYTKYEASVTAQTVHNESENLFYGFHGDRETGES